MGKSGEQPRGSTAAWVAIAVASGALWTLQGRGSDMRWVLVVSLSLSSFMIGAVAGFLFTSYGEETGTVGKVRDWLIGGLTGLTIAKVPAIKALLLTFAAGPGPQEFSVTVGVAVTYIGVGFFVMFFQRELILNVLLAQSRAERGRVEGTKQAGIATQKLLQVIPTSLLSGIDDFEDSETDDAESASVRQLLYSDDVTTFLKQAEEASKSSVPLDWDVVSKVAILQYYRISFEREHKVEQEGRAREWLLRALLMNPQHADLTAKYADVLWAMGSRSEAIAVLERLSSSVEAPAYIQQWLGYFLLFSPGREDDAIRLSLDFMNRFPDGDAALLNAARGYARKYETELKDAGRSSIPESANRLAALSYLDKGLKLDPDFRETVRTKWVAPGEFFFCFADDPDFLEIVAGKPAEAASSSGSQPTQPLEDKETKDRRDVPAPPAPTPTDLSS